MLLDLGLPDADGLSALHKMVDEATTSPVIVLTGRQERDSIEALAAGAQDYLIKDSLSGELLDRTIRYAVERSATQRTQVQLREERLLAAEHARLERGLLPKPLLRNYVVTCSSHYRPGRDAPCSAATSTTSSRLPDGRVRAVIGDVMGHGPDEAALGVHLRVAWRSLLLAGVPDEQILARPRRLLEAESPRRRSSSRSATSRSTATAAPRSGWPATRRRSVCRRGGELPRRHFGPPLGSIRDDQPHRGWPVTRAELPPGSALVSTPTGCSTPTGSRQPRPASAWTSCSRSPRRAPRPVRSRPAPRPRGSAPRQSVDDTALVVLRVRRAATVTDGRRPAGACGRRGTRAIVGVAVLLMVLVSSVGVRPSTTPRHG